MTFKITVTLYLIFVEEGEGRNKELEREEFKKLEDISNIIVVEDAWPFMIESQNEVASLGLFNMLSDLREESESLAVAFIACAEKFKKIQRKMLQ
jgi:hypothetical protein